MDAFAVAVADGSRAHRLRATRALKLAALFGLFQGLMPFIGWLIGLGVKDMVSSVDHWIAFGLLGAIGGKMIYADLRPKGEPAAEVKDSSGALTLLVLAVATSIDALAVGFSLTFLSSILYPVLIIGATTFALSLAGVHLGHRFKRFGGGKVQVFGGLVLIGVGCKILVEHLS